MKKLIVAIAMIAGFSALGQAADYKYEVGFGLVDSMPMSSDLKDAAKSALGFNFYGDYQINEMFTGGIEIGSLSYDAKGALKDMGLKSFDTMTYGVRGKYVKPMDFGSRKGKIYGIVGIASYGYETDPSGSDGSDMGFNLGGGIDLEVAPQWLVGFELRYHLVSHDSTNFNVMNPALKASYCF